VPVETAIRSPAPVLVSDPVLDPVSFGLLAGSTSGVRWTPIVTAFEAHGDDRHAWRFPDGPDDVAARAGVTPVIDVGSRRP